MSEENKEENLEEAVDEIKQKFGEGSIMKLEEIRAVDVDAIPTGSLDLDLALGVRGIPRGRLVEIFGPEASGKTTLALHVTAEAQNKGGTAAYVDAEHALDPGYARKIGVNVEDLLISQPDSGEQALEILESLVRSEAIDVIVVDSVAALTPQKEIAGEMGDDQVALQARLMSKACLTGDTELIDPVTGEVSTIGEIVEDELSWHTTTYDEENDEFVVSEVIDWIPQGEKEVFKVETKDGHTLKLTDDHEVFTMDGWKEVKDLTQQDHLAIPRKAPVSESNSSEQLSDESQEIDWNKISSISKVGKREVYDLSVKDHPNFVANGVLVHNCRKLSGIISDTKTSVIFLNQTRMKIGVRFGNPTTTPGGKALKFYSSVRIKLNRKAKIKEGDEITGSRIKAKVVKNKVAAPFRSAVFDVFYNEGISGAGDLIRTGTKYDVVERAGSWYKYGDEKLGQGKSNARDFLNENPEVAEEIEEKIIKAYKEQSEFEESPEEEEEDENEEEEEEGEEEEEEEKEN